jgi:hypothetical protein
MEAKLHDRTRLAVVLAVAAGLWLTCSVVGALSCALMLEAVPRGPGFSSSEQQRLALELGVDPMDYPPAQVFPFPYFAKVLQVGMPIQDVHTAVRGYKASYRCPLEEEIYYFLTDRDDTALRFMIFYDQNLRLRGLVGEDDDSRTITTKGCEPGLIEP